jgi:nicotinate phosphoribosyltransferase
VLSNQLDERVLEQIITQIKDEARREEMDADTIIGRLSYGVSTHLVTSAGEPALDIVYKLVGVKKGDKWQPAIKLSETPEKTLNPGSKSVWRLYDQRELATADLLCLADEDPRDQQPLALRHPVTEAKRCRLCQKSLSGMESLLTPVLEDGRLKSTPPDIESIRQQRDRDLERVDAGVKRIINPHVYHISLSEKLWNLKQQLARQAGACVG